MCSEVAKGGYGRKAVVVRINSLDSPWGEDDIREVAQLTLDAVVIPKVRTRMGRASALSSLLLKYVPFRRSGVWEMSV